ncbi:hypothetical protein NOGI109294_08550 [Nocardiopsis gilva]|uniref:hypothetical protein n=1 Tax=Nocardiopsis gilva TaxID=280236 RepID=UPI0003452E64|nr:hypothetical protein [Nocardiopsis gilva]
MAEPNRDTGSQDIIDDALRLVDALQRKLIIAGVRRGVSSVTSPPPPKDDVWGEAIRLEQPPEEEPLDRLAGIVRTAAPEVVGHLGKAGAALFGALGETWDVVEKSLEKQRADRERQEQERPERESDDQESAEAAADSGAQKNGEPSAADGGPELPASEERERPRPTETTT